MCVCVSGFGSISGAEAAWGGRDSGEGLLVGIRELSGGVGGGGRNPE